MIIQCLSINGVIIMNISYGFKPEDFFIVQPETRSIIYLGYRIKLSRNEYKIFSRLYEHPDDCLSAIQLLDECFPHIYNTPNCIAVHICNINKKTWRIGRRKAIISIYGKGYKFSQNM